MSGANNAARAGRRAVAGWGRTARVAEFDSPLVALCIFLPSDRWEAWRLESTSHSLESDSRLDGKHQKKLASEKTVLHTWFHVQTIVRIQNLSDGGYLSRFIRGVVTLQIARDYANLLKYRSLSKLASAGFFHMVCAAVAGASQVP
jgi:hypothetical protein